MTRRGHGRAEDMWQPTDMVGKCAVCHGQWQIKDPGLGDAKGCAFCGAPEEAITVVSEAPGMGGAVIAGPR